MATASYIPIIDISESQTNPAPIAKGLVDAAVEYGFVYIKNTGQDLSFAQVEQAFDIVRVVPFLMFAFACFRYTSLGCSCD
jgi:isopenicillin N synthase-like dioxygenase